MIKKYLDESNELLNKLITLTQEDIENIQKGDHKPVAESVEKKTKLIAEFSAVKKSLDDALVKLSDNGSKNLADLLDEEDKEKLGEFKKSLEELHSKNKEYAKFVLIVKDFLDGLLNTMFENGSGTNNAYGDKKTTPDSIFKMNV